MRGDTVYDLGEQFKFDLNKAMANPETIFQGNKYRITILTDRLVRLEYSEQGVFNDYPTEIVWYRNFKKPNFTVEQNESVLNIKTKYFELNYNKDKPFTSGKSKNLQIKLNSNEKIWYYGHPEVRNYSTSVFNINDTKDKKISKSLYSIDGFVSMDDSKSYLFLENGTLAKRNVEGIDTYVFLYGTDFYFCLNDYFSITGYPPMLPRYAFGNWWCKDDDYSDLDVARIARKFEENDMPVAMFLINRWQTNNNFTFNSAFKEPRSIINYLHNKNIKVGLSIEDPVSFNQSTELFDKVKPYLQASQDGNIPFNVFDARCIDAFLKLIIHPLNNFEIDFYSLNTFNKKNLERLFLLKHYLYYDGLKLDLKRPIISSQNFTYASHRYSVLYSGKTSVSWDTLKKVPSFNAKATNIGISFWSHDVGGSFGGVEDSELFCRFLQLMTFSPILRLGSDSGKYYKREPWKWGLKPKEISRSFLNLRHKLIPYIYTECYKYHKYGKPLIEPIYYRYPSIFDDIVYKDEYYFGSTFLISPITTKKDYLMDRVIQKIYLPDGIWYDFFTGKQFKGNRKYTTFYKDQEYPVFVKAGSIIPMSLNKLNDTSVPTNMEIQIFPGANNSYSIYEDDGETNKYLKSEYLITNVELVYQKNNYKVTILPVSGKKGIIPEKRNYKIRFKNTKQTSIVSTFIGSEKVKNHISKDDTDLVVEVNDVPTSSQLTVSCSGQDIEIEATRIMNEDIVSIISDLPIKTIIKQKIDDILFNDKYDLKKKRIEVRKLSHGKNYLERKYVELFLKLLEYMNEV